ncbi:MAG: hypothetical protein QG578_1907, partial [Thermodesulfobacteriota bacterium]|nr:hypothetical protein [Thermodesulfobacteriota bacterium]
MDQARFIIAVALSFLVF